MPPSPDQHPDPPADTPRGPDLPAADPADAPAEPPPASWRKPPPLGLPPDCSAEDALGLALRHALDQLHANEACTLERTHIEGVHQMRVALRRIRSILRLYRDLLPPTAAKHDAQLKWLIKVFGPARDFDVFLDEVAEPVQAACPEEDALEPLLALARAEREAAYARVHAAMASKRYARLLRALERWIDQRGWRDQTLSEASARLFAPATTVAAQVLNRHAKKVRKSGRHFDDLPTVDLHALRIKVKGLRYACDLFAGLYDDDRAAAYTRALAKLQTALGQTNDLAVARELMDRLIAGAPKSDQPTLRHAAGFILGYHWHGLQGKLSKRAKRWKAHRAAAPFWSQ